jgi:hypothetical protein
MGYLDDRRVQNPVLTNLAQGYTNQAFIGTYLSPLFGVDKEAGIFVKFKENKALPVGDTILSVGAGGFPNLIDFETTTDTYSCKEYAIGTKILKRELEEASNILQLKTNKNRLIAEVLALGLEIRLATALQSNANYTNYNTLDDSGVGKYRWTHASAAPIDNIQTAIDAVIAATGMYPDTLMMGRASASQLTKVTSIQLLCNPHVASAIPVTPETAVKKVADFFGIKNSYVGNAFYTTAIGAGFSNIWTDTCIVAHVGSTDFGNPNSQNFCATFRKKGRPETYIETLPGTGGTSLLYVRDLTDEKFINELCGYLIEDTVL